VAGTGNNASIRENAEMTENAENTDGQPDDAEAPELVRTQDFDTASPIELDLSNNIGPIEITLADTTSTQVEVRHDPASSYLDWRGGLSGLLSWVTEQFGESGFRTVLGDRGTERDRDRAVREPIAEAVRQTRIDLTGNRLVVRTPGTVPFRTVPLSIKVTAPTESQVNVRTGAGAVRITGAASRLQIQSGAGSVSAERAHGSATVRTGSGQVQLGAMTSGVQARSGSGDVEIASVEAPSSIVTGSGNVWLGTVSGDVLVRSGSGDLTVADAAAGQAELITGSGELQVSISRGVAAEVDLTSSTGLARSDLPVAEEAPSAQPGLRIYGRTGNGDALLTSAV
jgi:hypothetical protein